MLSQLQQHRKVILIAHTAIWLDIKIHIPLTYMGVVDCYSSYLNLAIAVNNSPFQGFEDVLSSYSISFLLYYFSSCTRQLFTI